ncbi:MAG: 5-(carboxyamino)imidazole ribonucleotide synthase [Verrucomicrobiota bacterium]|nr:5-(carboxyamino)imidazole ribonucleotide synthase [Verrucomicrobiota bacterium]
MSESRIFLPGSTIGVLGGGQLGRMFAIAARRMGFRVHTFTPNEDSPTGQLADLEVVAPFEDENAVSEFAKRLDLVTYEFENIPAETIKWCARFCTTRPRGEILHIVQNRLREKEFLTAAGIPVAPFARIESGQDLTRELQQIGAPAVLKSAAFGYDGKGQVKIASASEADGIRLPGNPSVLEKFIAFEKEISVLVARALEGTMATYPVCENVHRHHILDTTIAPANISSAVEATARAIACAIAEKLDLVGLLAVEMFLLPNDSLVVNELAPRPHNSGHFSFDACITSQFEQQLRAVCGLPLGSTELLRPAAMANLLGDLWEDGEPDWSAATAFPNVKLHLYGKSDPRPGRKMGHLVALGDSTAGALEEVTKARDSLVRFAGR